MPYTYTVETDPDNEIGEGFYSVFVDNGKGGSCEVAGKIGEKVVAEIIAAALRHAQPIGDDGIKDWEEFVAEDGREVRHDMHGFYLCTEDEAAHEDEGNNSAGFDGRAHFGSAADAIAAANAGEA